MFDNTLSLMLPLPPWVSSMILILPGLMVGSFANVVIFRLPRMAWPTNVDRLTDALPRPAFNLCFPNSFCPACKHCLHWFDNVPLLSYLLLRGHCRNCKTAIPTRYPMVECLGAMAGGLAAWRFGPTLAGLAVCVALIAMVAAAWIDGEHRRLPNQLVLPLLGMGAFINMTGTLVSPLDALLGAVLGYGLFWGAFWAHGLLTGRAAMGEGDFKLLAAIGAWFGWQAIPFVVLAAMVAALFYVLARNWRARQHGERWRCSMTFPFGPCLVMGVWGAIACQPYLNDMIQCASVWASV